MKSDPKHKRLKKRKIFKIVKIKQYRKLWTKHEDHLLLKTVQIFQNNPIKWRSVSAGLSKTPKQCYSRYRQINPSFNKGSWSKEEEDTVISLSAKYGKKWSTISKYLKSRSGKQIRLHYINILEAGLIRDGFSDKEDQKIRDLYQKFGPKWQLISKYFLNRTGDSIKTRFYSKMKLNGDNGQIYDSISISTDKPDDLNITTNDYTKLLIKEQSITQEADDMSQITTDMIKNESVLKYNLYNDLNYLRSPSPKAYSNNMTPYTKEYSDLNIYNHESNFEYKSNFRKLFLK